jgi:hypothetical protein
MVTATVRLGRRSVGGSAVPLPAGSRVYTGPWAVIQISQVPPPALSVPVVYYNIPSGHVKKKGPPPWAGQGHGPHPKKPKDK